MERAIIIVHPGTLGDVLLAVPAMMRLGERYEGHEVLLIARDSIACFLSDCGVVHEGMSLEGRQCERMFSDAECVSAELQSWLRRCDLAIAWMADKDGTLARLLRQWGVPKVMIQSPFSPHVTATHQRDRFLETVRPIVGDSPGTALLRVPPNLLEQGKAYLRAYGISDDQPLVIVHPGSGSVHKCLSPATVIGILQGLQRKGLCPIILEGPADQAIVASMMKHVSPEQPILKALDLSVLAGILSAATLYLGHDSGITHLAALLGVRTIAVFGPTDHHRWAPLGEHTRILCGEPCVCPSWEQVKMCQDKRCLHLPIEDVVSCLDLGVKV